MATSTNIDPIWQSQINQVTEILEKNGVDTVFVYRHPPQYPQGYIIGYRIDDNMWEAGGENLAQLVEIIVKRLKN